MFVEHPKPSNQAFTKDQVSWYALRFKIRQKWIGLFSPQF